MNTHFRILSFAAALLLAACFNDDVVAPPDPSACGENVLCRLENPADSAALSDAQKNRAKELLADTAKYRRANIANLDFSSLQGDTLQLELFPDVVVKVLPGGFTADSLLMRDLSATSGGSLDGSLELRLEDGEPVLGIIHFTGETYLIYSLGGNVVIVFERRPGAPEFVCDATTCT